MNALYTFSGLAENLSKTLKNEIIFMKVYIWIPLKEKGSFRTLEINSDGQVTIVDSQKMSAEVLSRLEESRQMIRSDNAWYFPAFDKNDL